MRSDHDTLLAVYGESRATPTDGRTLSKNTIPWRRFLGEAVLIVASVYLAIVLEGSSAERERRTEAIAALTTLQAELELDQADAQEILGLQEEQGRSNERIHAWLSHPLSVPSDSFSAALLHVLTNNRTMFPRKSSWTTMVSEGQLSVLGDPELVGRLANLYEHSNVRLEYNGARYDDTTQDMLRGRVPYVWDVEGNRFLVTDTAAIRTFGNQMLQVERQARGYRTLLATWSAEVADVQTKVDSYLQRHGGGGT